MIAIPNMEKPKGCRWCPLNHDSMCYIIQPYKTDETNGEQRRTDCPLIEIDDKEMNGLINLYKICKGTSEVKSIQLKDIKPIVF